LITSPTPSIDSDEGVMSPFTFPATRAYGTLPTGARGLISGSFATWTPRYRVEPSKIVVSNAVSSPSWTEK
jgi:hypothetical protein